MTSMQSCDNKTDTVAFEGANTDLLWSMRQLGMKVMSTSELVAGFL